VGQEVRKMYSYEENIEKLDLNKTRNIHFSVSILILVICFLVSLDSINIQAASDNVKSKKEVRLSASITLNKTSAVMYPTTTLKLKANVVGSSSKVVWRSSNTAVGSVNDKGKITAKKTGTFYVTASANGKFVKCKVTVKNYVSALNKQLKKYSWWSSGWAYNFGIFDNYVHIRNSIKKTTKKYKINYVQKTSYGYFINISGYKNYRWYRSTPYALKSYSYASGTKGYDASAEFWGFGC
jgi:hypothetical protein